MNLNTENICYGLPSRFCGIRTPSSESPATTPSTTALNPTVAPADAATAAAAANGLLAAAPHAATAAAAAKLTADDTAALLVPPSIGLPPRTCKFVNLIKLCANIKVNQRRQMAIVFLFTCW